MAIITKDDIKIYLGITNTESDTLFNALIPRAEAQMKSLLNREISKEEIIEKFIGKGEVKFFAHNLPVKIDSTFKIEIENQTDILETDISTLEEEGIIELRTRDFTDGKMCKIYYKGGFEDVPEDIKQAIIDIVIFLYNKRTNDGINNESDGPVAVTYQKYNTVTDIPTVQDVVEFYRIPNFA